MRRLVPFGLMAVLFCFLAPPAQAQDLTGDWVLTYSMMGRQGGQAREVSMNVTLAQNGEALTGTAYMQMRARGGAGGGGVQEVPISDGTIEGDSFTFSVVRGMGERSMTFVYSGKLTDEGMEGEMAMQGGPGNRPPIPFKGTKKDG
jgi:hypothetical protein